MRLSQLTQVENRDAERPEQVDMAVVRTLTRVGALISAAGDLSDTVQAAADGIVDALGFGAAIVNYRRSDGDFEVMSIAGPDDLQEQLAGTVVSGAEMRDLLANADQWGELRFIPHTRYRAAGNEWIPDIPLTDDPRVWHPEDMLLVPLHAPNDQHELVGVVAVDLPPEGLLPSPRLQELLEVFAFQATIAIVSAKERAEHAALLADLARSDELTGLPNRRAMCEVLDEAIEQARVTQNYGALLFCDVDGLKRVNDDHGHHVGDVALRAVATALRDTVRPQDVVARIGGDEFVIIVTEIPTEKTVELSRRVRELQVHFAGDSRPLGVSVGLMPIDGTLAADSVLRRADQLMYAAKAAANPPA